MMYVHFEPVPPSSRHVASDIADELRNHQGDWARVAEYDSPGTATMTAIRIRTGKSRAFQPAGAFEAQARTGEDRRGYVWARYVGEPADAS
ncbi:hypothetical protein [Streptomyces abikoensis]|uniref:Uncharacterized protein n=1 Tax=Streptomyces abikoensis TaxID=97398 RepID=A0ABW7T4W3_9ACTN